MIKPVVKWAGGKGQLLNKIHELLPKQFNHYYEPFVGGGALLFSLQPNHAFINDVNEELLSVYMCLQDKDLLEKLIDLLEIHQKNHSKEYFYHIRSLDRLDAYTNISTVEKAARMIYLNKAGFNGMYRVNNKGYFNVPIGNKKDKIRIYNLDDIYDVHNYLVENQVKITKLDFEDAVKDAKKGDFVYFDPPYDPYEGQTNFTSYSKTGFNKFEQERLYKTFKVLSDKGVYVMLSNHNTPFIQSLYKGFNIYIVPAKRMINSKAHLRGPVEEVIVTNYE